MKNQNSPDLINGNLIRQGGRFIIEKLTALYNLSIASGKFPQMWKNSTVTLIRKIARVEEPAHFRPINTVPFAEKVFERLIKKQIMHYIKQNNILIENQSGYREKHSAK